MQKAKNECVFNEILSNFNHWLIQVCIYYVSSGSYLTSKSENNQKGLNIKEKYLKTIIIETQADFIYTGKNLVPCRHLWQHSHIVALPF